MDTSSSLDEVYEKLKQHDPKRLETVLRKEWERSGKPQDERPHQLVRANTWATSAEFASIGPHDITASQLAAGRQVSDQAARIRAHDWSATALGPMTSWPAELRRMVNICMADPRAVALWWGPKVCLYNDAYRHVLAERDKWALGSSSAKVWPELVDGDFGHSFDRADATGLPSFGDDVAFYVERAGKLQEVWASWAMIPIPGADGNIGYYNPVTENTQQLVYERRMSTLLSVERETVQADNLDDFWTKVIAGLEQNQSDVPFAALYAASQVPHSAAQSRSSSETDIGKTIGRSDSELIGSQTQWMLQGTISSSMDSVALPSIVEPESAAEVFGPLYTTAITTRTIQVIRVEDETFPRVLQGKVRSRAYHDECTAAVLCPIGRTGRGSQTGLLLLGLSPRHLYDRAYEKFVSLLSHQLMTTFSTVTMVEDEARHARMTAEMAVQDRIRLSEKLALTEEEKRESERRFRELAHYAPIAMFEINATGELQYANDCWYDMTQHPRDDFTPMSWLDAVHESDREQVISQWSQLIKGESVSFEMRWAKPFSTDEFVNGERLEGETWVLAAAYPESPSGSVKNVLGCLVDISRQKWMERFQERRTAEALELKRQQETFMDMTSHEARNPLGAIMLCVESILESFREVLKRSGDQLVVGRDTILSNLDSAEIILACALHQKRIIDDVLMLSKLDSGMLVIAPSKSRPSKDISQGLKMFAQELHQVDVDLQFIVNQSYRDIDVEWVFLDHARLLQILINLVTNAIKFTKDEARRRITVTLDASVERPEASYNGVKYLQSHAAKGASGTEKDGVYLSITVNDTGRGLEEEELDHLFQRFQQASPKTHVKYGGSGLGLFISRELATLLGGGIGVGSTRGSGSTFAFFIRATRCLAPESDTSRARSDNSRTSPSSSPALNQRTLEKLESLTVADQPSKRTNGAGPPLAVRHLLLVEDNLVNQKVMSKQLKRAGFSVSVANHGQEALEHLYKTWFCAKHGTELDVVLMDVEMPVMDGLTCTRKIRAMEASGDVLSHVPILAVTANARAEQQNSALEAGMDSIITKPFKMQELSSELERLSRMYSGHAAAS